MLTTNLLNISMIIGDDKPVSGDSIVNQLFPNLPVFIAHVLATFVLLIFLWRLVYRPFRKALRARHLAIKSKIDDAANKQSLANQDRQEANNFLQSAKVQAQDIVNKAQNDAYVKRKSIIDQAQEEAARITAQSHSDIALSQKEALGAIDKEIKQISLAISEKILEQEINDKKHEELINSFIGNLR